MMSFVPMLIAGVLVGVSLFPAPAPTPPVPDLSYTRLQIMLRADTAAPVPGILVQLVPASPDLGGAPAGTPALQAVTDAAGTATFAGLGRWIWMARFAGQYAGRALAPLAEQGRPPYGTTRAGGGFPVLVQAQEEDEAPTPVVIAGQVQPEIQHARFVLLAGAAGWVPTLDLATDDRLVRPLAAPTPVASALVAPLAAPPRSPLPILALAGLGLLGAGGLGLGVLYLAARRRARQVVLPVVATWDGSSPEEGETL